MIDLYPPVTTLGKTVGRRGMRSRFYFGSAAGKLLGKKGQKERGGIRELPSTECQLWVAGGSTYALGVPSRELYRPLTKSKPAVSKDKGGFCIHEERSPGQER